MRQLTVVLMALLLLLSTAAPAAALVSVRLDPVDFDLGWEENWFACDGFTVDHRFAGTEKMHVYYEDRADGRYLVKVVTRAYGRDSFRRHGEAAEISGPWVLEVMTEVTSWHEAVDGWAEPHTWTERYNGVLWGLRVPREGAVYERAGQFTQLKDDWVVIDTINERGVAYFDAEAICRALGG